MEDREGKITGWVTKVLRHANTTIKQINAPRDGSALAHLKTRILLAVVARRRRGTPLNRSPSRGTTKTHKGAALPRIPRGWLSI